MTKANYFTKTERIILEILADGQAHTTKDLREVLSDELAGPKALASHMSHIRKLLRFRQEDIVCEYRDHKFHYRHIRLLVPHPDYPPLTEAHPQTA